MTVTNAFTSALAEERSLARARLHRARSEAERRDALERLADLQDIAARSLDLAEADVR